jgi:flagellar biosynthesis/type III secretory pathway protein FliH
MRPFLPPALELLSRGATAEQVSAEERLRDAAFESGRLRGVEEGLARGREEGRAAGRAEGLAAAEAEFALRRRDGAAAASAALEALFAARERDRRTLDEEMRAALAAALRTLMPALMARHGAAEAIAVAAAALGEREAEAIALRASPETLARMREEGFPAPAAAERLRLLPDPSLPEGSVEVTWEGGGLRHDPRSLTTRVLAVLGAADGAEHPQEEQQS